MRIDVDTFGRPKVDQADAVREFDAAVRRTADVWVAANGGMETPVLKDRVWHLYVYNPALGQHGWLDLRTDIVDVDPTGN